MSNLAVLVDYDNVEEIHRRQGPVNMARMLINQLPPNLLYSYAGAAVRLYGGWRSQTGLTTMAQQMIPDIRGRSPSIINVAYLGTVKPLRVMVELAQAPLGTRKVLEETFVKGRTLRNFRTAPHPWGGCGNSSVCGMSSYNGVDFRTTCSTAGCGMRLGEVLVRDEQKMVDTLLVSDIAHEAFVTRSQEVVVVSSDTDIWPGIHLALQAGCRVTQVHTRTGWKTQRRLLDMLDHPMTQNYRQLSV